MTETKLSVYNYCQTVPVYSDCNQKLIV